jgi:PPM family protein phosphatase
MTVSNNSSPNLAPANKSTTLLEVTLLSDVGKTRSINEDSGITLPLPEGGLFAVADGMGGHNAGDVASQLAVRLLQESYLESKESTPKRLVRALEGVNEKVYNEASRPDRRGMGTTITTLAVDHGYALVANVGDSRIYLLRGEKLQQLTRDHSWVAEQQRRGLLSEDEARNHRWRSVISNALGSSADLKVDLLGVKLEEGDLFLLCSDGLSGVIDDERLTQFLAANLPLERKARNLIDAANAEGGPDNITALLIRVASLSKRNPSYELPSLQGDGPPLARDLLGESIFIAPTATKTSFSILPILLWITLIAVIVKPEFQNGLIPIGVVIILGIGYQYWQSRKNPPQ